MKKIIFLTIPAYAHINPTLGIAKELVEKDNKVIIYTTPEFKDKVLNIGAEFRPPPFEFPETDIRLGQDPIKLAKVSLELTKISLGPLSKEMTKEQPDCLVHDCLSVWGKLVAIKTKVPTACLIITMAFNFKVFLSEWTNLISDTVQFIKNPLQTWQIIKQYRELYKQLGCNAPPIIDIFSNKEKLNIVLTSEYFQPLRDTFGSEYKFVGPVIYDRQEESLPENIFTKDKPIIYVSLGTVYNERLDFFKTIISAFKDEPYKVYISIGKYLNIKDFGQIPENILIKPYLPQLEILKHASVFISHGGMNSVNESLYFGVPMILFPQIQEQRINSSRVEKLGAGIYCRNQNIDKKSLIFQINKVLKDKRYKENALKIGETLKNSGGYKKAAEEIVNYAKMENWVLN